MGVGTVAAQAIVKNLIFVDDRFLELYLFSFTLFSTMVRPWSQKRSNLLLSSWYYQLPAADDLVDYFSLENTKPSFFIPMHT